MSFFDVNQLKLMSSWQYTDERYVSAIEELRKSDGDFTDNGNYPVLWSTRSKFVLLLTLADDMQVVYKAPRKLRSPLRYMFRPGPWGKEAVNYQILSELGLPMVKLVSAGETRKYFILKHGFLMTEYAAQFSDGREFTANGSLCDDTILRNEFIKRNFQYLAKMHCAGYIHKGFTPANLLFKRRNSPDGQGNMLDIKWIDVASCRKVFFKFNFKKHIARDLSLFFHFFDLSRDEKLSYLDSYCQENDVIKFSPENLLALIDENPVR